MWAMQLPPRSSQFTRTPTNLLVSSATTPPPPTGGASNSASTATISGGGEGQQAARAMAGKKEEEEEETGLYRGDKLILRGLRFHGTHGVKPEEKKLGQKFVIDVDAWMDLAAAGESDNISDTVSYTEIYRIAKTVVEGPSHNLLESVAQSIANSTLLKFPQISAVRVRVEKPHVAVQGVLDCLGVQIFRQRKA